ncbi:MAG: type I-E CRISPR-associated endonuclease Cas1e [Planctomycetia bacterium]|nr:type I-E CRISPR-associated endonuclease Cas1e [Planctomycetia bacterium]
MAVFEKVSRDSLPHVKDRWTPVYLEHGRLEVDDSSVKWIGADFTVLRIPVATVSALLLGPGTSVTHAAVKACAECNTPIAWVGEQGMRFYAFGSVPTHDNSNAKLQAELFASVKKRTEVAKRMFLLRFPQAIVESKSIEILRGMEGKRVKALYAEMGERYGVLWKGRNYDASHWHLADGINRAISAANASLYALCTSIVCSMGFLPHLGFIHKTGTLPFVFDIADIYKPETTLPAAFQALSIDPEADETKVLTILKQKIESSKLLKRIPVDIFKLLGTKDSSITENK